MSKLVPSDFFSTRDAVAVAPWLLGKTLVRLRPDGTISRHLITEAEAYSGPEDLACHASKGRTARTEVMFQPGGVWYVYLCYGMHEMLNLVVGPKDFPAAVLIRGLHDVTGPGRLTKRLAIDRKLNGKLAEPAVGLHIEDEGYVISKKWMTTGPRVGVDYAGPLWAKKPWRFMVDVERLKLPEA